MILVAAIAILGMVAKSQQKTVAREFDARLSQVIHGVDACYVNLGDRVSEATGGDLEPLLSAIRALETYQDAVDRIGEDAATNEAVLYVGAVRAYAANTRVVAEKIYNFLEQGKAKDYEDYEKYLKKQADIQINLGEKRQAFLFSEGWSYDEVAALYAAEK